MVILRTLYRGSIHHPSRTKSKTPKQKFRYIFFFPSIPQACRCVRLPDFPIEELSLQDSFPCGSQYLRYFRDLRGQVFPRLLQFGNKQPVGW